MKPSRAALLSALLVALAAATSRATSGSVARTRPAGEQPLSRTRRQSSSPKRSTKKQAKDSKAFELECLAAHNKWRQLHQVANLQLDPKLTAFAQKRADFIAASDGDEFKHPSDLPYGENLAWHSRETKSCAELVKMWYDEIELYDFAAAAFSHETGHFTQLVWKSSERVGCARAISSGQKGGVYLVCNYDPPGNFLGEGRENVFPAATRAQPAKPQVTARPTAASSTPSAPTSSTRAPAASSTTSAKPADGPKRTQKKKKKKGGKKSKKDKKKKGKKKGKRLKPSTTTPLPSPSSS